MTDIPSLKVRRKQNERSESMRQRLIQATLKCLVNEGYAGTTISKIVETAEVSRGAPMHHFSSKANLIEAAAEFLIHQYYDSLKLMINELDVSEDRIFDVVKASWQNLFIKPETAALLELMVASRHESDLAIIMQRLWILSDEYTRSVAENYLEPVTKADNVGDLIKLTKWLLIGMAEDCHINIPSPDSAISFEYYLKMWSTMLGKHLRAKK